MEMQLRAKNYRLTPNLEAYIEKKVPRLERYLDDIAETKVEISGNNTRSQGLQIVAQLTVTMNNGTILRAEERSADPYTSLDAVLDTMERQIARFKDRRYRRGMQRRAGQPLSISELPLAEQPLEEEEEEQPSIVKVKQFMVKPMFSDEAVSQMELLDHDFFIFLNAETDLLNVVYRRKDGQYGLIEPIQE
ncbi:MAG: ribosome-associated translation inhibitor RaiA [Chloroflexia bacterium]|nr:ribosome-associated translation inhibitor RaiA [Chloroflexia bacterium]